jgi:hypothetical protein
MTWHLGVQWFNEQGYQPDALGFTGFVKANYRMRVPWTQKHLDLGLGEGISYVDRIPMSEQRDFAKKGPDIHSEKLMNYLEWTVDLPLRQFQSLEPLFRGGIEEMSVGFIVWHRLNGADRSFPRTSDGSSLDLRRHRRFRVWSCSLCSTWCSPRQCSSKPVH